MVLFFVVSNSQGGVEAVVRVHLSIVLLPYLKSLQKCFVE